MKFPSTDTSSNQQADFFSAHYIKNGSARMTKAMCSIEAVSRWAVTATPLQNRLADLATLLQFIRAHPYDDPRHFERDISQLWKDGDSGEAVRRLKQLTACLILRRNKGTIDLPPRKDLLYPLEFSSGEREEHQRLRQRTISRIDDLLHDRQQQSTPGGVTYLNALQRVETLRLICDLGIHYSNRAAAVTQHDDSHDWKHHAQAAFNRQCEMATVVCLQCSSATGLTDALLASESLRAPQATFFQLPQLRLQRLRGGARSLRTDVAMWASYFVPGRASHDQQHNGGC